MSPIELSWTAKNEIYISLRLVLFDHILDDLVPDIQIDNVVLGGAPRLLNFVQETPKLRVNTRRGTIF